MDEDSLKCAIKLKAQHNEGGKITDPLSLNITDSCIQSNLCSVGICIGQDSSSIDESIGKKREAASSCERTFHVTRKQ
jgi:hypothetical protein